MNREEIKKNITQGVLNHTPCLYTRALFNNKLKFGVIITKKTTKQAVVRNKLKRKIKEIVRRSIPQIKNKAEIIFLSKPGLDKLSNQELNKAVLYLLSKNNLI